MNKVNTGLSKEAKSWILYDWANSAFATAIMAGFFPLFFKNYWSAGAPIVESTWYLGLSNAAASMVLAIAAPFLGTLADKSSKRKTYLFIFAVTGIVFTTALAFIGKGEWPVAMVVFVLATIGFAGANIFYDSLLPHVQGKASSHFLSAAGYAFGYLGGGVLFAVCVFLVLQYEQLGFANKAQPVQLSFVLVAIWWLVFSLPLWFFYQEKPSSGTQKSFAALAYEACMQLKKTFRHIASIKPLAIFLIAYFFYIDGVHTIIKMAVDYGLALGFSASALITALLITQFVGFPSAIVLGTIAKKTGPRPIIYFCLLIYTILTIFGYSMNQEWHFFALAIGVGLVQGGIQSQSRSLFSELIPSKDESGEFFGFYNMFGRFSAIMGPLLVGMVGQLTGNPRFGVLSILTLFVLGFFFLRKVPTVRA